MKQKLILAGALTLILAFATVTSFSNENDHQLLGESEPITAASRIVVIDDSTAYVNVTHGDTVEFVIGNKLFAWDFDGAPSLQEIDLDKIAPTGSLNHKVRIYIARNRHVDYGN